MSVPLHLLLVEDSPDDATLIVENLSRGGYEISCDRVDTATALRDALRDDAWDLVISDYCMPGFDARGAIEVLLTSGRDTPLIVVSGTVGEDVAVETLQLGAEDYLLKQNLTRLVPAVMRTLLIAENRRRSRALESMKSLFMEKLLDMICTIDAQGRFTEVSSASEFILGYAPDELVGHAFLDFVHPDDQAMTRAEAAAIMAGNQTTNFENRYLHRTGKIVELLWSANWSEHDQLMIAVARDVTEHRRKDEALRLRERALGEVSQGVLISDENRLITYANASFTYITGYTEDEMLGRNCSLLQGPGTDPDTIAEMRAAIHAGLPFDCEILNYRKDGTPFWNELSIAPIQNAIGGPLRFVGIQRDVTARRMAEEALRQKTTLLEAVVESSLDGIKVVDAAGKIILQNERTNELWDLPPEIASCDDNPRILDFAISQTKHPLEAAQKIAELFANPDLVNRDEIELVTGKILDRYSAPVRDRAGHYYGRIWTFRDITEARAREQRLARALALEQKLTLEAKAGERAKGEFLAVMSHEVRTPLNGILGFAELLSHATFPSPEYENYSRTILQSGEALLRILDDILEFSRLESGRLTVEMVPFSPRELLEDIRSLLARQADEKGLTFTIDIAETIPAFVAGDPGRLRQILLNLTGNAIKFTQAGFVAVRLDADAGEPPSLVLRVQDSGPGIAADQFERIFQPFTQADSSISRRYGGTGLGLTISHRLGKLLGGTLTVNSPPGAGTEFTLSLPLRAVAPVASATQTVPLESLDTGFALRHPLSILIVEDDKVNLKLMETLIRRLGYQAQVARDGREAVKIFRIERPTCILMDLQMPEMDGIQATEAIRNLERTHDFKPPVFISALTADIFPTDRKRSFDAGMNEYLNKPAKFDALARVLARASQHAASFT